MMERSGHRSVRLCAVSGSATDCQCVCSVEFGQRGRWHLIAVQRIQSYAVEHVLARWSSGYVGTGGDKDIRLPGTCTRRRLGHPPLGQMLSPVTATQSNS